ncbi:MAG: hydantoinase B/oxoprolinase family protein [Alphaproteobacteria bacterium]|nr:hydantoinase B/oxoprolinase family protein [Alphaproteobacteria bacterium]
MQSGLVAAFDIGGTFTDLVLLDRATGALHLHKCLTTPDDPARGALGGLDDLLGRVGVRHDAIAEIVHGTTIVTNAIIERRGARTALITTRGYRDIIEMGTEQRYDIHDVFLKFPEPLVPRSLRLEVGERLARDGSVVAPLTEDEARGALVRALKGGAEAVAVCFLHAYRNDAHERVVAALAAREFPDLRVSISSEVCGEIREYERVCTVVANAYVQPLVEPYVRRLESALSERGFHGRFSLMQSSGTLATPEMARRFPIRLLESGPAGGAIAAASLGRVAGHEELIAFDMGGTTAKVCLIEDGRADVAAMMEAAREHRFKKGSGIPIRSPVVDMIEIGAGGGSIARRDDIGLLKVGPRSAGAAPGPACYGLGGSDPTVTDANLALGYLDSGAFLGGRMALDPSAAEGALSALGASLDRSAIEAAWGIYAVVCDAMANAARVHVVEKGKDPRRYAMVAFGGAGPAHAAEVARALGVGTVVVPPASGAASALGFLGGRIGHQATRSQPAALSRVAWAEANGVLEQLEGEGRALLRGAGAGDEAVEVEREAEMRLSGQVHNLRIAVPLGGLGAGSEHLLADRFAGEYRRLYGRDPFGGQIEVMSWRVACSGPEPSISNARLARARAAGGALKGRRPAYFPAAGGFVDTPVYDRYRLEAGFTVAGPAIVEEDEATTIVPPGDRLSVDAVGNLVIAVAAAAARLPAAIAPGLAAEVARLENDPIGLEILWSRLISISEECWLTVIRTAFSLIIGDAQDFACEILDAKGQSLAHSPRAMPVFNLTLMAAVNSMLERHPPETLRPGDVLVTNDPWLCAGHLFDIAVVTPVFRDGKLVALVGAIGHVSDIGGTKDRMRAREVYEEGIQIPPLKLYRAGQPNEDLFALLAENVRTNRQVLGDVQALVAANALGAQRINALLEEYGLDDLQALAAVIQDRAEKAARKAIAAVPDGQYRSEVWNVALGQRQRFPICITVKGDTIDVDYEGVPAQLPRGGLNCTMGFTEAETFYPLKCLLTPDIRASAGCYRAFTVRAPEGTIMNCMRPASVGLRHLTGWYIIGNVFQAMAGAMPDRVRAFTGLPTIVNFYGTDPDTGLVYGDHIFLGGGQGGGIGADGKSSMIWPTSAANGSIEVFETRVPVLVLEKAFAPDSGGAGRFRGGLGQYIRVRRWKADDGQTLVNVYPEGVGVANTGLFGGQPGGAVRAMLLDRAENVLKDYGEGTLETLGSTEHIIEVRVGGGAGYGPPKERPLAALQRDIDEEYVSVEAARRDYGCVVGSNGRIDGTATERARQAATGQAPLAAVGP